MNFDPQVMSGAGIVFVVGLGIVFLGLVAIILLLMLQAAIFRNVGSGKKKAPAQEKQPEPAPVPAPAPVVAQDDEEDRDVRRKRQRPGGALRAPRGPQYPRLEQFRPSGIHQHPLLTSEKRMRRLSQCVSS